MAFDPVVWIFAGLPGVNVDRDEVDLGCGFSLIRPTEGILSARDRAIMSGEEYEEAGRCGKYLVYKLQPPKYDQPPPDCTELQNGLLSFQIIKPTRTSGWLFLCEQWNDGDSLSLKTTERRPPMESRRWARMRWFDDDLLSQVPEMIFKVRRTMRGTSAEHKNAIILLQLALENMHPLIAGLLHVMGMDAIFDSTGRHDFKTKLCDCLGPSTAAFPNWNAATFAQPKYTVEELAIPIYMLRSKLAHGTDLRKAAVDKSTPVDLVKKVELSSELEPQAHAFLLAEAACYLHCQVLQRIL